MAQVLVCENPTAHADRMSDVRIQRMVRAIQTNAAAILAIQSGSVELHFTGETVKAKLTGSLDTSNGTT